MTPIARLRSTPLFGQSTSTGTVVGQVTDETGAVVAGAMVSLLDHATGIPYVKGVLFLDRLRTELGPEKFWKGIALYTSRNAGGLADSRDFQRAMEEASERDLKALFEEAVYH